MNKINISLTTKDDKKFEQSVSVKINSKLELAGLTGDNSFRTIYLPFIFAMAVAMAGAVVLIAKRRKR